MNEKQEKILQMCLEKELDVFQLDVVNSSLFRDHNPSNFTNARVIFNGLAIVYGFNLEEELLRDLIIDTDTYAVSSIAKSLIPEEIYNYYYEGFLEEFRVNNNPIMRKLDESLEELQELNSEFEEQNNKLEKTLA